MNKDINLVIVMVILIFIIIVIVINNIIISKRKRIERNKSLVDIYLKKRYDLIPNLVEICKGYSKYEEETLKKITELRNSFNSNYNAEANEKLNDYYNNLISLVEKYPELKASELYLKLQHELVDIENELQASRRIYINSITEYNTFIMKFPISIISNIFGYKEEVLPKFNYENE